MSKSKLALTSAVSKLQLVLAARAGPWSSAQAQKHVAQSRVTNTRSEGCRAPIYYLLFTIEALFSISISHRKSLSWAVVTSDTAAPSNSTAHSTPPGISCDE